VLDRRLLKGSHLKCRLQPLGGSTTIEAIAFNTGDDDWPEAWDEVRLAYRLDVNEFRGQVTPQLVVEHQEPA